MHDGHWFAPRPGFTEVIREPAVLHNIHLQASQDRQCSQSLFFLLHFFFLTHSQVGDQKLLGCFVLKKTFPLILSIDRIKRAPAMDGSATLLITSHFQHHQKKSLQLKYQFLQCILPCTDVLAFFPGLIDSGVVVQLSWQKFFNIGWCAVNFNSSIIRGVEFCSISACLATMGPFGWVT